LIRKDGGKEWLWTLVRFDMRESLAGPSLGQNLLTVELVDRALADLPFQAVGFYLAEGRPEERALAHAWGKHGHGKLIAVVHATIAYWDLRYHFDPLVVADTSEYRMPMGELLAVNGPAALEAHLGSGVPPARLIEVEALRYEYLRSIVPTLGTSDSNDRIRIVIIGEYRGRVTDQMLKTLESAVLENGLDVKCLFRPHPNYSVNSENWQGLGLEVVDRPLNYLLDQVDLAVASSGSSAVVDAYMAGVPVAVYRPPDELPLTDLLGRDGVFVAATAGEMRDAITNGAGVKLKAREPTEFFCLDPELSKWRRLLVKSLSEMSPA
jgi:surface carbohydrate biosynthesis protein (TIGR04326 family)